MSEVIQPKRITDIGPPHYEKYLHPVIKRNYGKWLHHENLAPGVLCHVAESGERIYTVRAGSPRLLGVKTLRDFAVCIVDDASQDATAAIARSYADRLAIEVLPLNPNRGVAGALNHGLAQIQTPFIARLDADDLALPQRLEKQYAFLLEHPEVDVCSSWMELFYDSAERPPGILAKPPTDAAIKTALVQYCSMSHGASLFRKSFFDDVGHFDLALDFAEDDDLWCRGALRGKVYANLPEALTSYRAGLTIAERLAGSIDRLERRGWARTASTKPRWGRRAASCSTSAIWPSSGATSRRCWAASRRVICRSFCTC